jgi:transcriptional regulator with XRE-family HTH domain
MTTLSDKIKRYRKEKRLTLEQLGALTGSSKSYVWELENRNPPRPSAEKIARVAAALGVTPEFLLDDDRDRPEANDIDLAFFRKYQKMPGDTKKRLRQILDAWDEPE